MVFYVKGFVESITFGATFEGGIHTTNIVYLLLPLAKVHKFPASPIIITHKLQQDPLYFES